MKRNMKTTITVLILALAVWACHRKTVPSSDNNIVISNKTNTEVKSTTETKTETTSSDNSSSTVDLATAGKTVYTTRCNRCHGLKNTENYTQQQWTNILKSMIPKARLNEDESKQVTAYVMANAKK